MPLRVTHEAPHGRYIKENEEDLVFLSLAQRSAPPPPVLTGRAASITPY